MTVNGWIEEEDSNEEIHEEDPEEDPEEDYEGELDEDICIREIIDETYPIRGRDEPLPPPSFQVYRHPNGGPLWMNTPRKRLLPIHRLTLSLISTPVQDAPPLWTTQLHS